jgi:hypothetical protein
MSLMGVSLCKGEQLDVLHRRYLIRGGAGYSEMRLGVQAKFVPLASFMRLSVSSQPSRSLSIRSPVPLFSVSPCSLPTPDLADVRENQAFDVTPNQHLFLCQ